mgnify:CR=1 FL=1
MSLTAREYNHKYFDELENSFEELEWYEDIEERLWYYDSEQQITDDLAIIKNSVLEIYSSSEVVDWSLIKPLKIKLNQLQKNLNYFKTSQTNKQKVSTARINQTRELINQIWNLNTSSWEKLKTKYETWWLNQMKVETFNLFNSQVAKLSNMVDDLWKSDDKISDLETESTQLIEQFCNECELYLKRNRDIFNAINSKEERSKFVLDSVKEVVENWIWPNKFKIILWKKFDILDTIEEYSKTLYDLINDYWLQEQIIKYLKEFVISKL